MSTPSTRRVVLVTGGGGGIGAAIATELARRGDHVVTVDPLVSVDGSEPLPASEPSTAERIVASGGSATASSASVTDREALRALAAELVDRHGRIDAVVNVAGITRPTGFATGDEADWSAVLAVHLGGYVNVLDAVLPHMATAGAGHVVGVTSGSGWRAADAGAYSCAKRAVAALTWQLGRRAPEGVAINAISPIAMTRMVAAALARTGSGASAANATQGRGSGRGGPAERGRAGAARSAATGGLSLGSMPEPSELAPLGAWLAGHGSPVVQGRVLFAGGSEVALIDPPRPLEVVRTGGHPSPAAVIDAVVETLERAEAAQGTTGGTNPRFTELFRADAPPGPDRPAGPPGRPGEPGSTGEHPQGPPASTPRTLIVSDRPELAAAIRGAVDPDGSHSCVRSADVADAGFDAAGAAVAGARAHLGGLDLVVTALAEPAAPQSGEDWAATLSTHAGLPDRLRADAAWARAVAVHAATADEPVRLVSVTDARTPGGRSRAQAVAQLARASRRATGDRVAAFAVELEAPQLATAAATVRALALRPGVELSGAELAVGDGWIGLRSHPAPAGSVVFGGPDLPDWFGDVVEELCR